MTPCQMKFRNQLAVNLTKIYAEKHPTAGSVEPMVDHAFAVADAVCARISKDAAALEAERAEKAKTEFDAFLKEAEAKAVGPKLMSLEELFASFEADLLKARR